MRLVGRGGTLGALAREALLYRLLRRLHLGLVRRLRRLDGGQGVGRRSGHHLDVAAGLRLSQLGCVELELFDAACQALGAAFASRRWRIMVGVPIWEQWTKRETVAPHILAGANSVKPDETTGAHPIVFYAPREPEEAANDGAAGRLQQIAADHPNLTLEYKRVAQSRYKAKMIPNVASVDAVVLVAGKDGTATIGYAAHCLERPVLAVAGFGGAARELLDDVLFDAYDRYQESVQLTDGELLSLTTTWKDKADDAGKEKQRVWHGVAILHGILGRWPKSEAASTSSALLEKIVADERLVEKLSPLRLDDERKWFGAQARGLERFGMIPKAIEVWKALAAQYPESPLAEEAQTEIRRLQAVPVRLPDAPLRRGRG